MRLGIDLDGVVADVDTGSMEVHRDEFGSRLTPDVVTSWNGPHELGGFDGVVSQSVQFRDDGVTGLGPAFVIVGRIGVDVVTGVIRRRIIAGAPALLDDTDGIDEINGINGHAATLAVDTGGAS